MSPSIFKPKSPLRLGCFPGLPQVTLLSHIVSMKSEGSKSWERDVQGAQRAVVMSVHNFTSCPLVTARVDVWHGTWRLFPPGTPLIQVI